MGGISDIVIAGAGPAGLATAIAARQLGLKAVVVDCRRPPIDRACGEGLMPDGVAALRRLGIQPPSPGATPFHGIRFLADGISAEARFADAPGLGIRRTVLHSLLVERAAELGVAMRWGMRLNWHRGEHVSVGTETITCKWLIGADGHNSWVRRNAGLGPRLQHPRIGVSQHYTIVPWTDFVEVYWHPRGQAYVTPIGDDEINVVLMGNSETLRLSDVAVLFPTLYERLEGAPVTAQPRAGATITCRLNSVVAQNAALVGDASGSVDAITGEGLSLAFRQSLALADALVRDDLNPYQAAHRRMIRVPRLMAKLLLTMGRHEWLCQRAIYGLATHPTIFARLLAVHAGDYGRGTIKLGEIAGLLWRMFRLKNLQSGSYARLV